MLSPTNVSLIGTDLERVFEWLVKIEKFIIHDGWVVERITPCLILCWRDRAQFSGRTSL